LSGTIERWGRGTLVDARTEALQGAGMDPRLDRDMLNCSIARTLAVVDEKWTILILREVW
jgi:DNA-binding HxlR family transcriptional regulator